MATANALTNYGENATLNYLTTGSGTKYLALFSTVVSENGTGTELSGAWYSRKAVTFTAAVNGSTSNSANTSLSIQYARIPVAHTNKTDLISLDDTYAGLIVDYLLYRAYSKDASVGDANLANNYGNMFYQQLGVNNSSATRATTTA